MTAEENQPPSGRAASRPPLVRVGAVTDAFFEAVEGAVDGLPRGALERLARGGVTIRVAATLTAALPELRRVPVPPAYAALGGGGWDGIAGAYVWSRGRIGIAEYVELLGARFENELALYALRHEVGHALDDLGRISSSPVLRSPGKRAHAVRMRSVAPRKPGTSPNRTTESEKSSRKRSRS